MLHPFPAFSDHADRLLHFVTERAGGASPAPFESLNLGFHVPDAPANVRENRECVAAELGVPLTRFVLANQTHGVRVAHVGESDAGRGACAMESAIDATDALITDTPNLVLTVNVADCVPILLYDPVRHAAAAIHAGWKGTYGRIAAETVRAMGEAFGSRPGDLLAGIGPAIHPCCYEVDAALYEKFHAAFGEGCAREGARHSLDLPAINARILADAGVAESRIDDAGRCTACESGRFFSHRKEAGKTGRFWAGIMLR